MHSHATQLISIYQCLSLVSLYESGSFCQPHDRQLETRFYQWSGFILIRKQDRRTVIINANSSANKECTNQCQLAFSDFGIRFDGLRDKRKFQ